MTETRWWRSRWLQVLLSLAVVVAIFSCLFPKVADYSEVWKTLGDMTRLEIAGLGLIAAWNLASYWPMLTASLPGLRLREAATANLASTAAANTFPGGAALGVGATASMQHSWGISGSRIALAQIVSGIWNNFVKLGLPIVALALVAVSGEVGPGLVLAAAVGLAVLLAAIAGFAVLLRSDELAARVGSRVERVVNVALRAVRRPPVSGWDDAAARFRSKTVDLLNDRWMRITVSTLVSHVSLYVVLLTALRNVGVANDEVSWQKVLAAFAFVRLLSAIPVTPGGLGVVELGLTAALGAGLPDTTKNQIAAAVLLFRALTWFLPIPLGFGAWMFWRANTTWRHTVDERRGWLGGIPQPSLAPQSV